jgi:dynein heavy chain
MERNLNLMQDILEEWMLCQRTCMYLQNIFDAPDNKRQLSADSQMFEAVDKFYRYLMRKTYNKQSIALHAQ